MEYYHYVNIFETKGLEYILVICFMITFVLFIRHLSGDNDKPEVQGKFKPGSKIGETIVVVDNEKE